MSDGDLRCHHGNAHGQHRYSLCYSLLDQIARESKQSAQKASDQPALQKQS